jgi:hypothetical protein
MLISQATRPTTSITELTHSGTIAMIRSGLFSPRFALLEVRLTSIAKQSLWDAYFLGYVTQDRNTAFHKSPDNAMPGSTDAYDNWTMPADKW